MVILPIRASEIEPGRNYTRTARDVTGYAKAPHSYGAVNEEALRALYEELVDAEASKSPEAGATHVVSRRLQ